MWNLEKALILLLLAAILCFGMTSRTAHAEDQEPIKSLVEKYHRAGDEKARIEIMKKLSKSLPKTAEDVENLRRVFKSKDWDENLFSGAAEAIKQVSDPSLDKPLIDILHDEKQVIERSARKDYGGKSEREIKHRAINVITIIQLMGVFKSQNAVPVLKEYLAIPEYGALASDSLAMIGDKSGSDEMKCRAYKGEEINYAGQGLEETLAVIRDLEDKSKKDQWPKIAKQIFLIRDRRAKPHLKRLFNHENMDVRWESARKFTALADESDAKEIIEMSKNSDMIVRAEAAHAMQKIKGIEFGDELISMLTDTAYNVRREAAKALGYKKIVRAVPYLEKALRDAEQRAGKLSGVTSSNEISVCNEAYIALYLLTDKKYDYKGKSVTTEHKAELRKGRVPSSGRNVP